MYAAFPSTTDLPTSAAASVRRINAGVANILARSILALFFAALLTGCKSLHYYPHLIGGHLELIAQRESIDSLIADPDTDSDLRRQLQTLEEIRRYAAEELQLPAGEQYRTYVTLNRPFVTWNVYATPEFSLSPKIWRYPVIGAAGYRGFFSPELARTYSAELADSGLDVCIVGASAYSTLGWFQDPLPSTILKRGEITLANIVFHELAHQVLYVSGDTTFNESFATAVAEEGTRRYLSASAKSRQQEEYILRRTRHQQFTDLVADFRHRLETLYARDLDAEVMRRRKQAVFSEMSAAYVQLKSDWQGYSGYDGWFAPPLNNAKIASLSTYNELVPLFLRLLDAKNGDLPSFYETCRDLAAMPMAERRQRLQHYAPPPTRERIHPTKAAFAPLKPSVPR